MNDANEPLDPVPLLGCVRWSVRNSCVKGAAATPALFQGAQWGNDHVLSPDDSVAFAWGVQGRFFISSHSLEARFGPSASLGGAFLSAVQWENLNTGCQCFILAPNHPLTHFFYISLPLTIRPSVSLLFHAFFQTIYQLTTTLCCWEPCEVARKKPIKCCCPLFFLLLLLPVLPFLL